MNMLRDVLEGQADNLRTPDLDIDADSLGRWWCVRTNEGHTGAITVKTVSVEAPRELVLGYVLWR